MNILDAVRILAHSFGINADDKDRVVDVLNSISESLNGKSDALDAVDAIINISEVISNIPPAPNLQEKTVGPLTESQTVTYDNDYDGLSSVTISAVTAAIDENIVAGNIKNGVTILGVEGTYTGV